MKKHLLLVLGCSLLGACVAHEADIQAAQEKRDAALMQKRSEVGCTFLRDHDAYRQCIMNTYYMQHPQTYETHELTTGQPIAVISNTSCGNAGCAAKVAPLPASGPQIVPYSTSESRTVETTCTQNYQAQEASVTTTEVLPPPAPVQIVTQAAPAPAEITQQCFGIVCFIELLRFFQFLAAAPGVLHVRKDSFQLFRHLRSLLRMRFSCCDFIIESLRVFDK